MKRSEGISRLSCWMAACMLTLMSAGLVQAHELSRQEASMRLHHLHVIMNHGLGMALEGESLVMQGRMGMSPELDEITIQHGQAMLGEGSKLLAEAMNGEAMQYLHKHGHGKDALMGYTHRLGQAMQAVVQLLQDMPSTTTNRGDVMSLHHMHVLLVHALDMALEGDELVMLGRMKMVAAEDKEAVEHGEGMIKKAQSLWSRIMHSKAMQAMHKRDMGKSEWMRYTHRLGDAVRTVMDLLQQMPA